MRRAAAFAEIAVLRGLRGKMGELSAALRDVAVRSDDKDGVALACLLRVGSAVDFGKRRERFPGVGLGFGGN